MGHRLCAALEKRTLPQRHANEHLVVQDDTQERVVDVNFAVVLDEAQFSEFVHKEINAGAGCANYLRQGLLRHL